MRVPDSRGYYGEFGGRFVPETLIPALLELERAYKEARRDPEFRKELLYYLSRYAGRPTPLYFAERLSDYLGFRVYLKREDLLHTGAHKINNTLGQILLARRMGKRRIIAETGAGQHGVATATVCARFGMKCVVYMGEEDMRRQELNVLRMRLLGAEVVPVKTGARTLKEATSQAIRDWVSNVRDTFYIIGSVVGPHPYPMMVRDFQSVIGEEVRRQFKKMTGRPYPDLLIACVGGGSNAMGLFYPFYRLRSVEMIGVEAKGEGFGLGKHSASLCRGKKGVLHGAMTMLLQDEDGQVVNAHSIAAGLDYPGVGPEHAFYKASGRARYVAVDDRSALKGLKLLSQLEGIIPAMESAHAVAYLSRLRRKLDRDKTVVLCLSGRGDKDMHIVQEHREDLI